jgi:hypothetical protein
LLPNQKNLGDYVTRVSEAIEILATVENCSQLEIIGSLITNYPNITIQGIVTQIASPNGNIHVNRQPLTKNYYDLS